MSAITTRDVPVGDVTFHLSTSGDPSASPVLWLHGSGPGVTALTNWDALLEDLAGDFYNIAPDIVGYGDSTHPDPPPEGIGPFTAYRVEKLVALLDELGHDQVDVVGNSMGGIIGMTLTVRHPERVRRIVLMGAGGAPVSPTPELLSLILFYEDPTVEAMAELMTKFVADPAVFGDQLQQIAAERIPRATRPRGRALAPGHVLLRRRPAPHQRRHHGSRHPARPRRPRRHRPAHAPGVWRVVRVGAARLPARGHRARRPLAPDRAPRPVPRPRPGLPPVKLARLIEVYDR